MGRAKRHPPGTSDGIPKRRRLPVRAGTNVKPTVLREGITLFKEIWRLLRQDGWTAKPPRRSSLDTRYRYVKPGQDPNGIEGEDYFLGEDALVLYYRGLNKQAIRVDGDIVTIIPTKPGCDAVVVSELGASGVNEPVHCDESDFQSDEREFGETTLRLANKGRLGGGIHGELGNENGGRVGARHGVEQGRFSYEDDQGDDSSEDKHEGDMHEGPGDLGAEENGVRCEDGQANRGGHRGNGDSTVEEGGVYWIGNQTDVEAGDEQGGGMFGDAQGGREDQCGEVRSGGDNDLLEPVSELYLNTLIAFSPSKEPWIVTKTLKPLLAQVGNSFIVGRVCRRTVQKKAIRYEIRWLDSLFQNQVHSLDIGVVQRGIENYRLLTRTTAKPSWNALISVPEDESLPPDATIENLVVAEGMDEFDPVRPMPLSLGEVEAVKSMKFDPRLQMEAPTDLYTHSDGSTKTRVRPDSIRLFTHSASSSFLAYIPLYFWRQIVTESNAYAIVKEVKLQPAITLAEMMKFIGILFYMSINNKGEYANYWGAQPEDTILGNSTSSGLEKVMPLRRFKLIRKCFCFLAAPPAANRDPAARIRPLLNLLKCTGGRYIDIGRNVALDESSIACRSKFGRHMIVYNPMKPTGKYHFRLYMLCCATSWIAVNYRLHCNSEIAVRLEGVVPTEEASQLQQEWVTEKVSAIRSLVLEVARPIYGSNRVLNTDNYYTSIQLLQALRLRGLYGRGTVRGTSKHFPRHTMLDKHHSSRGDFRQGVSAEHAIVAASWCDGSVVQIVSNADGSSVVNVERQVGATSKQFPAPESVKQYNQFMQGVDRLDQIRARFSLADGHSYKKWHKKLALALIDIARSNAYLTRRCVVDVTKQRDPHRSFIIELASELISGQWVDAPSDGRMAFEAASFENGVPPGENHTSPRELHVTVKPHESPRKDCIAVTSRQVFKNCGRKRRGCIICRWEDRWPTEMTDFCGKHSVCLCRGVYSNKPKTYMCPDTDLTCWEKFHRFYLPNELSSAKGNIRLTSGLYKIKEPYIVAEKEKRERLKAVRSLGNVFENSGEVCER